MLTSLLIEMRFRVWVLIPYFLVALAHSVSYIQALDRT